MGALRRVQLEGTQTAMRWPCRLYTDSWAGWAHTKSSSQDRALRRTSSPHAGGGEPARQALVSKTCCAPHACQSNMLRAA